MTQKLVKWTFLIVTSIIIVACGSDGGEDGPKSSIAFQLVLEKIAQPTEISKSIVYASSNAELAGMWNHPALLAEAQPVVDFSRQTVLLFESSCRVDCVPQVTYGPPSVVFDDDYIWYRNCTNAPTPMPLVVVPTPDRLVNPYNVVRVVVLEKPGFVGGEKAWSVQC